MGLLAIVNCIILYFWLQIYNCVKTTNTVSWMSEMLLNNMGFGLKCEMDLVFSTLGKRRGH